VIAVKMRKLLYPGGIRETHTRRYRTMKKHLTLPGEIILQFLQDNEEQFQAGATHYERTSSRKAHRDEYRKRTPKIK